MANLFWVGGSAAYDGVTNRLATTSGGAASVAVITSADTVTFDANSPAAAAVTTSAAISSSSLTLAAGFTGSLTMSNTLTVTGAVTHTQGTLNTNGQTCTWGSYSSANTNVRTLTMGSSPIELKSGGTAWNTSTFTNLTVTANTSTVTCTGAASTWFGGSGFNTNGGSIVMAGSGLATVANSFTCANLTRTGTASKTDSFQFNGGNTVITGTLTITGNSTVNRVIAQSLTVGTACGVTAAAVSLTNVDFRDISAGGASIPWTGTSLGNSLGNSNITFDSAVTRYWVNGTGSWGLTANWSTSSGGSSGASVPLPQDNVIIDNNSGSGFTITFNQPRLGKDVTFTATNSYTYASSGLTLTLYGSLTLSSGLSNGWANTTTYAGRGSQTITTAGKSMFSTIFAAPGGTYTLQDAFTSTGNFTLNGGTLVCNNYNVTALAFLGSGSAGAITLNMGSGMWAMTSTATITIFGMGTGTVTNSTGSNILIANASANTRTFVGTTQTFGTVTYTVDDSPGYLVFIGSNTFTELNVDAGKVLQFTAGTTNTFTDFNVNGSPNGYLYSPGVISNAASTPHIAAHSWTATSTAEFIYDIQVANWSSIAGTILCKETGDPGRYWKFSISAGVPNVVWYPSGTVASQVTAAATTTVPFTANQRGRVKVVMLLNNGAGGRVIQFYTSTDYDIDTGTGTWTQLGTDVTGVNSALGGTLTPNVFFGSLTSTINNLTGRMYRMRLKVDSSVVFDANFATKTVGANTFTESSPNAATVTIAGELMQAGDGRVTIISSSAGSAASLSKSSGQVSSNYLSIKDSTATGGAAWYAGANSVNVSGNTGWIFTNPPSGDMLLMF